MSKKYLEPYRIGNVELKNRIMMLPMGDGLQNEERGVSQRQIDYFTERAKGGVGLILMASNPLNDHGLQGWNIDVNGEDKIPGLRALTDSVHGFGAKMGVMLGLGFGGVYPNFDGSMPKTPSEMPLISNPKLKTSAFTTQEIYTLIEQYGYSAGIARQGGYDMVHIQAYGGYLIDLFTCKSWNKRTDEFGGSFEARMKFPLMLVESIHKHCGDDFPIIYKFSPFHAMEEGRKLEEGIEVARVMEKAGVAAFHIDIGKFPEKAYELIPPVYHEKEMSQFDAVKEIKKHVKVPVYTQGKAGDPEKAKAMLEQGKTDLIALGRSFVADPMWAQKVMDDRAEDIVPCICCNEGCIGRLMNEEHISCAVNPRTGREGKLNITLAPKKKKIFVVGAGPGGATAALLASRRGHDVELWEQSSKIGGQLIPAGAPSFKREVRRLTEYYKAQLYKDHNIRLHLAVRAEAGDLAAQGPDMVVVATGSVPVSAPVPGVECAVSARDVLMDLCDVGDRVVIVGGGYIGCETAVHLARAKKDVTVIEALADILSEPAALQTEYMLRDMLKDCGVRIQTASPLVRIEDGAAFVRNKAGEIEELGFDTIVMAVGSKPNDLLGRQMDGRMRTVVIGDALHPGRILDAVWKAYEVAEDM